MKWRDIAANEMERKSAKFIVFCGTRTAQIRPIAKQYLGRFSYLIMTCQI